MTRSRPDGSTPLLAAGGVVTRPALGSAEVALVHRPRFDDWSLPKGKLKRGERAVVAAVREVFEETGIRAVAGTRLPTVSYDVWSGEALVEKVVDYWAMTVVEETTFVPGVEVDGLTWLPVRQAIARASYPHDKRVLRAAADLPALMPPIVLLRHASAGERASWTGPDAARPLDATGRDDAVALAAVLASFGPTTIVSAEPVRCQETVQPLARSLDLPLQVEAVFNEDAPPEAAAQRMRELVTSGGAVVICSQGGLIPPTMGLLNGRPPGRYHAAKGDGWVLSFGRTGLTTVDALPRHGR